MTTLGDFTPDSRNANRHSPRGLDMVQESLQKFGAGRSILVDKHGNIIAGNATVEAAGLAGMEDVLVVKTDGTKLVAVQRTDLDINDPRARELAISDNRSAEENLVWDADVLQELSGEGVNIGQFWTENELDALIQSASVPDFEPVGIDEQGRLDEKKKCTCPECGHTFSPE